MSQTLTQIAETLKDNNKKVQLIYAFNGTGKTRLSRKFREKVDPKDDRTEESTIKAMYYNAFTEDLFYWDNDLDADTDRKLLVQPNNFTNLALSFLKSQDLDNNIITNFQRFTTSKITPSFNDDFSEITFNYFSGGDDSVPKIKISKGEESNFIWCVFYSLIEQIIELLNTDKDNRSNSDFDDLKYFFIDDPVSSLDENHLIELAVNLAQLIKKSSGLNFVISTHNPLFYNVLYNELNLKGSDFCYLLSKNDDGTYNFDNKYGDSNKSFSYHLYLKNTIEEAIKNNTIEKYHFTLLRNLYEKTANFLGYEKWSDLLPDDKKVYYNRVIQFTSHSTLSNEVVSEPTNAEKNVIGFLLKHLIDSKYWKEEIVSPNAIENQVENITGVEEQTETPQLQDATI